MYYFKFLTLAVRLHCTAARRVRTSSLRRAQK